MTVGHLIRDANDEQLIWALLVAHEDGRVEAHDHDGNAYVVPDLAAVEDALSEWLLVADPVACDVAVGAGVLLLNGCGRCDALIDS